MTATDRPTGADPAVTEAVETAAEAAARREDEVRTATDWVAIRTVMAKDLTAVKRSKAIMIPMIAVPLVLLIFLPLGIGLFARSAPSEQVASSIDRLRDIGPFATELFDPILTLPERERLIVLILGYLLSPMLLVIPLMVSAVLAADAFAGEKERRTLEGLLHLPVADRDLFVAKVLGAFLPAIAITWGSAVIYAIMCNAIAWPVTGRPFLPFTQWTIMVLWVAPAVALLALGLLVVVSSRAKTTQEANQLGGAVILPLIFLAAAQASTLLLAPPLAVVAVGVVVWLLAIGLVAVNARRFTRDRLASSS
ncbi:MAG: ABC transporter permease subunit [Acidimicrobiales bacterium]